MLETLEARVLMSASYDPAGRVLEIVGTDGSDVIRLHRRGDQIVLSENGVRTRFRLADVARIRVAAGAGDDFVSIDGLSVPCSLYGQEGDDKLRGGARGDRLDGGNGNDQLYGRGGNDIIYGFGGNDTLVGGGGKDHLLDSDAGDFIDGGAGADTAAHPGGRSVVGIEAHSLLSPADSPDPLVEMYVSRSSDGVISVHVVATHGQGGFERVFGELEATGARAFTVQVTGRELGGATRTQALESEAKTYVLGALRPGTYTLTALSGDGARAIIQIGVTEGALTLNTVTRLPTG